MTRTKDDAGRATLEGGAAGFGAGVFLTLAMTAMAALAGKDIWYGMKGAAAPFLGDRAMVPGFDAGAVALGLVSHFAVSVIWGVLFALAVRGLSRVATMIAGVAWGFVVWLGMYYVVLPMVGLSVMRDDAPVGRAILMHLMYSIPMAAIYLAMQPVIEGALDEHRALPHTRRRAHVS